MWTMWKNTLSAESSLPQSDGSSRIDLGFGI
jgi:hypothetical protein